MQAGPFLRVRDLIVYSNMDKITPIGLDHWLNK